MALDHEAPTSLDQLDAPVRAAVEAAGTILVPVDDGRDPALALARTTAIALAGLAGAKVVLLDRSDTTYADTPRVGELSRADLEGQDHEYLVEGLDAADAAGVQASAFVHSLPGDEAFTDAAKAVGAGLLVVPVAMRSPGLFERLKGDLTDRAIDAAPEGTAVVTVGDDGRIQRAEPGSA